MRRAASALSWYERGLALESVDPAAAITAYERALAGRPDLADAHNNLGRLHHDAGRLPEAEARYRQALAADASVALYHFILGVVLEDSGRAADAIASYERALAIDAHLADAHYNLARQLAVLLEVADRAHRRAACRRAPRSARGRHASRGPGRHPRARPGAWSPPGA